MVSDEVEGERDFRIDKDAPSIAFGLLASYGALSFHFMRVDKHLTETQALHESRLL